MLNWHSIGSGTIYKLCIYACVRGSVDLYRYGPIPWPANYSFVINLITFQNTATLISFKVTNVAPVWRTNLNAFQKFSNLNFV